MDAESETEDFSEDESDEFLPAVYAERDDLRSRLGKIIDSLSEVQKQTVVLHYFNEQKVEEIAYIMECNVGTVKSRLFLARKAIRAEVEEEERKSGEKFYGIAGIPMLSLGSLLNGHFEAQLLTTDVFAKTIAAISEAISQGIAEGAATIGGSVAEAAAIGGSSVAAGSGAAAGGTATAASGTAATATTATGLSAGAKGAIISAIAVVGIGCGLGGVFLVNSFLGNNDEVPDIEPPPAISQTIATPTPTPLPTPTPATEATPESIVTEEDLMQLGMELYGDLLAQYREVIVEAYNENRDLRRHEIVGLSNTLFLAHDLGPFQINDYYFSFYDLNGDGIPELLLVNDMFGEGYSGGIDGFGFHTWVEGTIYTPDFNMGARCSFDIYRGGIILIGGPSGASGGYGVYYRLSADSRDLEFVDAVSHRVHDTGASAGEFAEAFRYNDRNRSHGVRITKAELDDIVRGYVGEWTEQGYEYSEMSQLIWHPLSEVP